MVKFTLEELKETLELFSETQCDSFSEYSIVALELCKHKTGCQLSVVGEKEENFQLNWNKEFKRAGYKEEKKIIEHGAEAISFFLSSYFTEYSVIEEARIGTGFDYWLGYESGHKLYDAKNFIQARLEVSGIKKETITNSLSQRSKSKKKQTTKSDGTKLPAYISIVEFSTPKAYFGKK